MNKLHTNNQLLLIKNVIGTRLRRLHNGIIIHYFYTVFCSANYTGSLLNIIKLN